MQRHLTDTIIWEGKMYIGGLIHNIPEDLAAAIDGTPPENLLLVKPPESGEEDKPDTKKADSTRRKPPEVTEI